MKKKIISILICMIIVSTIQTVAEKTMDADTEIEPKEEPTSLLGITIIAGYVLNPTETSLGRIEANAIALLYYDRGIIHRDAGIVTGLKKISFKDTSLLIINEQGPLGLTKVFGICTGFFIGF